MKSITLFFSLFGLLLSSGVIEDKYITFMETINEGYDLYCEVYSKENNNYKLVIVQGICNDKLSYSIQFTAAEARTYDIIIKINQTEYKGKKDGRGDYLIYNLDNKKNMEVIIRLNATDHDSHTLVYYDNVDTFLSSNDNLSSGLNEGIKASKISKNNNFTFLNILIIIFFGIIIISSITIFILFITKKGMFSEKSKLKYVNARKSNSGNYRHQQTINVEAEEVIESSSEPVKVYERQRSYTSEDEDFVKGLLKQKGFSIEYKLLDEDAKTQVMIELMKMRNNSEISQEQYKAEVIDLWS